MSWLRMFEAYRDLEATKIAAEARAEFLQDQNSQLLAQIEKLDDRAQEAQIRLVADREKVADMFAVQVLGEGVYDAGRQHPSLKRAAAGSGAPVAPAPGPTRVPAHVIARDLAKRAWMADTEKMQQEARDLQRQMEEKLGITSDSQPDSPGKEATQFDAQASAG